MSDSVNIGVLTKSVNHVLPVSMERSGTDIVQAAKRRVAWLRAPTARGCEKQAKALAVLRPTVTYSSADGDTVSDMLRSLRSGDVVLTDGADRLANSVSELRSVFEAMHKSGAILYDAAVGCIADPGAFHVFARAVRIINGERRGAGMALAMKRREHKGGRRRPDGSMNVTEARAVWRNHDVATNAAAAAITGWSIESLNSHFGPSGRPMGRPRTKP